MLTAGSNGEVNAIPKERTLDSIETYTNIPIDIPKNPEIYPKSTNINLKNLK